MFFMISRRSCYGELINLNGDLSPENILESNEKNVNNIYLNHIAIDRMDFSDNEKSMLHEIANQCPFAGGKSVYKARFILNLLGDSTEYNDEEYCVSLGFRKGKEDKSIELLTYPNPANGTSTILLSVTNHPQLNLKIYDVSGRELGTFIIPENQQKFTFKTAQLTEGMYELELSGLGIKNLHSKLLIAR